MQVAAPIPVEEVPGGQLEAVSMTVSVPVGMPAAVLTVILKLYCQGSSVPSYGTVPAPFPAATNGRSISVASGNLGSAIPVTADFATVKVVVVVDLPYALSPP